MKRLGILAALLLSACGGTAGPTDGAIATQTQSSTATTATSVTTATPGVTAQVPGSIDFTPDSPSCSDGGTFSAMILLSEPAGAPKLTLTMAKIDVEGGEQIEGRKELTMTGPNVVSLTDGPLNVADWCMDPFGVGTYHWSIIRPADGKELADGLLTIAV